MSKRQFKFLNAAEGWERAIQREDGEIFTIDLERIQREEGVV